MNNFDEIEKRHYEQYETDPEYRAKFDAESARRVTELERLENQQSRARNEAGRYTLEEAARFIADNSNSIYSSILGKLKESADAGKLPFYAPNSNEVFKKRTAVLGWREEVFYDDLNEWLKNNEPRLGCSFPKINTVIVEPAHDDLRAESMAGDGSPNGKKILTKRKTKLNDWLREKWDELDKPSAKDFASKLKPLQGTINCPVKRYYGWIPKPGVVVEWQEGWGGRPWGCRAFENKVSDFRRADKMAAESGCQ
jgi:hypothetical protein